MNERQRERKFNREKDATNVESFVLNRGFHGPVDPVLWLIGA